MHDENVDGLAILRGGYCKGIFATIAVAVAEVIRVNPGERWRLWIKIE